MKRRMWVAGPHPPGGWAAARSAPRELLMTSRRLVIACLLGALCPRCAVGPDYQRPALDLTHRRCRLCIYRPCTTCRFPPLSANRLSSGSPLATLPKLLPTQALRIKGLGEVPEASKAAPRVH
jgi:hypothetical protein